MSLNKRLQLIMNKLQISQADLARQSNLSTATISNILRGDRSPNYANVEKIISVLSEDDAIFLILGNEASNKLNEMNEDIEPYQNSLRNEFNELRSRVESLERWKIKVTEK